MIDNPIPNAKLKILTNLSEQIGGCLRYEKYGLSFQHVSGKVRWVEMDQQTCGLIFDLNPETDLYFELKSHPLNSFFHSLFLLKGNVVISGLRREKNLRMVPNESLYFHTREHNLGITIRKSEACKLILISHTLNPMDTPFLGLARTELHLGLCSSDYIPLLKNIYRTGLKESPFFELKGLLFLLLGSTMPKNLKFVLSNMENDNGQQSVQKTAIPN